MNKYIVTLSCGQRREYFGDNSQSVRRAISAWYKGTFTIRPASIAEYA